MDRMPKSPPTLDAIAGLSDEDFYALLSNSNLSKKTSVSKLAELIRLHTTNKTKLKSKLPVRNENPTASVCLHRAGGTTEQDVEKLKEVIAELGWDVIWTRHIKPNPEVRNGLVSLS